MNNKHAYAIVSALANWYEDNSNGAIHSGALLFDDNGTLEEHVTAALGGISIEAFAEGLKKQGR